MIKPTPPPPISAQEHPAAPCVQPWAVVKLCQGTLRRALSCLQLWRCTWLQPRHATSGTDQQWAVSAIAAGAALPPEALEDVLLALLWPLPDQLLVSLRFGWALAKAIQACHLRH